MSAAIGGERVEQVPLAVARPGRLTRQNNNDTDSATGRGANVERKKRKSQTKNTYGLDALDCGEYFSWEHIFEAFCGDYFSIQLAAAGGG